MMAEKGSRFTCENLMFPLRVYSFHDFSLETLKIALDIERVFVL
jgi:hypothetical protein